MFWKIEEIFQIKNIFIHYYRFWKIEEIFQIIVIYSLLYELEKRKKFFNKGNTKKGGY